MERKWYNKVHMILRHRKEKSFYLYIRNFIFGVEDSLVSTVGLISGIAVGGVSKKYIFLTGIVLIFVEAFSMGVGSLLSEHSAQEFEKHHEVPFKKSITGALIMFVSYLFSGAIPIFPYLIAPLHIALFLSVAFSLISLFLLGAITAKIFKLHVLRHGLEMFFLGGIAIVIGIVVGNIIKNL